MLKFLMIILMSVVAAVAYGVVHDQATVRICREYFTAHHGDMGITSPTLMALYSGAVATWWAGAGLGLGIAGVSRMGGGPKVEPREVMFPIVYLLLFTMGAAILAGIAAGIASSNGWVIVTGEMREQIPADRRTAYLINHWAHTASYVAGAVGGVFLAGWIAGRRSEHRRMAVVG